MMNDWIAFAESGNQQRIVQNNGQTLQGWVVEINDDALCISSGDGERGVDTWLPLAELRRDQLFYFDHITRQWVGF